MSGAIAAALLLVVGYLVWDWRTDSLTGPEPSVAADESCGGSAPTAVLAFDASTGDERWSALAGRSWGLDLTDATVAVSGGGRLRALDVGDGRARWCGEHEPDGEILGVTAAGSAFVGGGRGDAVVAYAARDGDELWTRAGVVEWVTSDGDVAVLRELAGDDVQTTRGVEGRTGEELWSYESPVGDSQPVPADRLLSAPELGLTFVHDGVGVVGAGPPSGGSDGWRWSLPLFRPIGVHGDVLVGGVAESFTQPLTRFGLQAVDAATGRVRWEQSVPGFDARVVAGIVVVLEQTDPRDAPGPDGTTLNADGPVGPSSAASATVATGYDPANGRVLWERELPFAGRIDAAGDVAVVWTPAPHGDPSGDGRLIALDPQSGIERWRAELANPARSERYHVGDDVIDAVYDEDSATLLVLLEAREPYRD